MMDVIKIINLTIKFLGIFIFFSQINGNWIIRKFDNQRIGVIPHFKIRESYNKTVGLSYCKLPEKHSYIVLFWS